MKWTPALIRQVCYVVGMVLLLLGLPWLSMPSSKKGDQIVAGGHLAALREEHRLTQTSLGEIDPAGETMKLATLGLRGVAANILWHKANHYKMTEDWDNFAATVNQIIKLQPHYVTVWEFQAHNLSYNISVEFDDYRHRYLWVKKGIGFLMEGTDVNQTEPRLTWDAGWYFGNKLGKSDEREQYRRLFRDDEDFHAEFAPRVRDPIYWHGALGPDNWLVGREWFLKAQHIVDTEDVRLTELNPEMNKTRLGKSPVVFHSDPAMALMKYAEAIEKEGVLDEKAQQAWDDARKAWRRFGDRPLPTSWGHAIRLNDYEAQRRLADRLKVELEYLAGDVGDPIRAEKLSKLAEKDREAYEALQKLKEKLRAEKLAELTDQQRSAFQRIDDLRKQLKAENITDWSIPKGEAVVTLETALRQIEQDRFDGLTEDEQTSIASLDPTLTPELIELAAEAGEQVKIEGREELQRFLNDTEYEEESYWLAQAATGSIEPTSDELVEAAPDEVNVRALALAVRIATADTLAQRIDHYRDQINFNYWRARAEAEMTDEAILARKFTWEADELYEQAKLVAYEEVVTNEKGEQTTVLRDGAKEKYEAAWVQWAKIFEQFPLLLEDATAEDLITKIERYNSMLSQLGEPFPQDFPLNNLLDVYDKKFAVSTSADSDDPRQQEPNPPEPQEPVEAEAEDTTEPAPNPPEPQVDDTVEPDVDATDDPTTAEPAPAEPAPAEPAPSQPRDPRDAAPQPPEPAEG